MRRPVLACLFLQLSLLASVRVDSTDNRSTTPAAQVGDDTSTTLAPVTTTVGSNDTLQRVENFLAFAMGNQSTSGIIGVAKNAEGDFATMRTAFFFNLAASLVAFAAFSALRVLVPAVYTKDAEELAADQESLSPLVALEPPSWRVRGPRDVAAALFDWLWIIRGMQDEEVIARCGLDGLQMLELLRLGRRLTALWSSVIVCLLCPLHYYLHSHTSSDGTFLSMTSMNGLATERLERQQRLLLIWMHTATVWFVVLAASYEVYAAQCSFLERRFEWLKRIPEPRATTLLVENLPPECRSDFALHQYFARLFPANAIAQAYVVRRTDHLRRLYVDMERAAYDLHCAQRAEGSGSGPQSSAAGRPAWQSSLCCHRREAVVSYARELEALREAVAAERRAVEEAMMAMDPKVCSCAGFVTFTSRRMCMLARQPQYRADSSQLTVAMPPDPADVLYYDLAKDRSFISASFVALEPELAQDPKIQASGNITAAGLLLLIFVVWAPLIATFMDRVQPVLLSVLALSGRERQPCCSRSVWSFVFSSEGSPSTSLPARLGFRLNGVSQIRGPVEDHTRTGIVVLEFGSKFVLLEAPKLRSASNAIRGVFVDFPEVQHLVQGDPWLQYTGLYFQLRGLLRKNN